MKKILNVDPNGMISVHIECSACRGTGLYIGFAEGDGTAVVCTRCNGTGEKILDYKPFIKRNPPPHRVKRVFQTNFGYRTTPDDPSGMPVEDWDAGKPFPKGSEDRERSCPAWFYQSADCSKKPDWDWCAAANVFSQCRHFPTKQKCWERWDKEYSK